MPSLTLDAAFFTSIVKQPVSKVELASVTSVGDNMAGDIVGITVHTPEGSLKLIHKTMADSDIKAPAVEYQFYRKEAAFYRVFLPKLEFVVNQQLQQLYPNALHYKFPAPKVYAAFNNDCDDYLIVEDVRPSGYQMPDKFKGLELDEVKLVLTELARFHANSYFLIRREGERIFDPQTGEVRVLGLNFWSDPGNDQDGTLVAKGSFFTAVNEVANEKYRHVLSNLFPDDTALYAKFVEPYRWTDSQLFPVIVLGDCWVNNIMIKRKDKTGAPASLRFLDFQLARRGNIFEELLYFVYTSTTAQFRRNHLAQVLNLYYAEFSKTLATLQVPMPPNFSQRRFLELFNRGRFSAFMFSCFAIPIQLGNHNADASLKLAENGVNGKGQSNGKEEEEEEKELTETEVALNDMMNKGALRLRSSPQALKRLNEIVEEMFVENIIHSVIA